MYKLFVIKALIKKEKETKDNLKIELSPTIS